MATNRAKSDTFASQEASTQAPRRRGRPPKTAPTPAPSSATPIGGELAVEWVPIESVIPYTDNPRIKHDVEAIANSLRTFGWRQPLVVDADRVLIVGHGRLQGAHRIKATHVPIHVAKDLTPAQVRAYRLADNKVAEGAVWDEPKLLLELQGLRDAGEDGLIALAGFDLRVGLEQAASKGPVDTSVQFHGLVYRVVVDCADESDQAMLLERLEGEGRTCRALIS